MESAVVLGAVFLIGTILFIGTIKQTAALYEKAARDKLTEDEFRSARFSMRTSTVPWQLKLANLLGFISHAKFRTFPGDEELLRMLKAAEGKRVRIYFLSDRFSLIDGRLMRANASGSIVLCVSDNDEPIGLWAEQVSLICLFREK